MFSKSARSAANKLPDTERLALAKRLLKKTVNRANLVLALHESNRFINYSNVLAEQIPPSLAGNAFRIFQNAMHQSEITNLMTLWDKPDGDLTHQSIPNIALLLDSPRVKSLVLSNVRRWYPREGARIYSSDESEISQEHLQSIATEHSAELAENDAQKANVELDEITRLVEQVLNSDLLASVKNIRDKHFAHGLEATRAEKSGQIAAMRYGDETKLLEKSVPIIERLHLWVAESHFDFSDIREMHADYAGDLWNNCTFSIDD